MRSIVYDQVGSSDVLRLVERAVPTPGPGEVRVRVVVSGVNPTDWKRRSGQSGTMPAESTPNQDGAGVIDAVGEGVTDLTVGDRVWVLLAQHQRPTGTAQEYTVLPQERVIRLPDSVSFDVGASLGVPAMTAYRALTVSERGPRSLSPGALAGQVVLVSGGAGAVGHAAIQLARWAGATVVSTVSGPEKSELARRAGAHHLVNYREGDPAAAIRAIAPGGVDIVVEVDVIGNRPLLEGILRTQGTIAVYANSGTEVVLPMRAFMSLNARIQFVLLYSIDVTTLRTAAEEVTAAAAAGVLEVGEESGLPLIRFPLAQTAAAHDAVQAGVTGKVLIDVQES